ncbi:hypothetical protein [Rathayibacter sp. VKM Ac-2760]|uniref:hypothetical protein n=1 Tax=Rathayibacter sp. VKM Ac-2760 TaxID=2609253 RepID=UPI001317D161|nr:hypothetical protein [Rathayibacter sp. VKM Ac-2760]QHC60045.1 hypothetical protein GSU72_16920 [Rathayibacter sp. VKM Ac-2760]
MSQHPSDPAGPTRRSLAASAAWSLPVVSAAVAAPLAAASPVSCLSTTMFTPTSVASNPTVLTALSSTGVLSTVRISSVLAPGTTTETRGQDFDLTRDGSRWASNGDPSAVGEVVLRDYPDGSLMLNQRRAGPIEEEPSPGSDLQTLTFEFLGADGRPFDPTDVRLTIQNITSFAVPNDPWLVDWWSTVGFSVPPASISAMPGHPGAGAGTVADPFRRDASTDLGIFGGALVDTFIFRTFPSGSTLAFSQHQGQQGWHAIALSALSFVSRTC